MTDVLLLSFVFLVAGVLSVPVAARLGLGSVLGYLIAGILISPILTGLGVDVVSIQHFAEFGVVMMLFLVGLELDPRQLWGMRGRLMGLGGGQVALTTGLVMAGAMALGQVWSVALAIGLVLALSSTAIVLQTLGEKGLLRSDGGRASFSVLLFQDIAVIPILALLPLLALPELAGTGMEHGADHGADPAADHGAAGEDHGGGMSLVDGLGPLATAAVTFGAVAAVVVGGSTLTRPVFRFIAMAGLRELFVATALMMVVGIALLMSLVGLSPALGTFLAGVVLANSEYRHELESDIDPFRGLLLGLFFMTVGAGIDFGLLASDWAPILGLTVALMAVKATVLWGLARVAGLSSGGRWLVALGLAQAGEFGFVLLSFTVANAVIPAEVADRLLLVIALSMLLTPALFILYDRVLAPRGTAAPEREADDPEAGEIIIAGRGRVGGMIHRMLTSAGYRPTVIDYDSRKLDALRVFGTFVHYGDATRPDLLAAAGIDRARVLVVAIDGRAQITELVRYAVATFPNLHVVARAVDRTHVYDLWAAGCRDIIREVYDSSLRMGRSTFEALGVERPTAEEMVGAFRAMDRRAMVHVADTYRADVPEHENAAYVAAVREVLGPWQDELGREMSAIRDRARREEGAA